MKQDRGSRRSTLVQSSGSTGTSALQMTDKMEVGALVDVAKKLYTSESIRKLDQSEDEKNKLCKLHEVVFGCEAEIGSIDESNRESMIQKIKDKLSEDAAKWYIEESIKKEVIKKMQQNEKEYLNQMKLQIIKKHSSVENATTLKKLAQLEKQKQVKLSKSILNVLRPQSQEEVIGQKEAVESLISKIASPFPQHVLLYGPPGVGKTTAARIALRLAMDKLYTPFKKDAPFVEVDATTLRWDPREAVNPLLGSVHDPIFQGAKSELAELGIPEPKPGLVTEAHGGVLFIDEIGELDPMFQNKLLKVLEDKCVSFDSSYYDIGNEAVPQYIRTLFEEGAPADFVLIGATTRSPEEINPALRSRCAEIFFNPLENGDIQCIVKNAAEKLNAHISEDGAALIGSCTFEARKAVNILADCYSSALNISTNSQNVEISTECIREIMKKGRFYAINQKKADTGRETGKIFGLGVSGFMGSVVEFEAICFKREDECGTVRFNETAGSMTRDSLFNAMSVVRKITGLNLANWDIHVNCIGGGKIDGPSAGVALTCLLYSAVTGKPARMDTSITGEISIRGCLKPVGGVPEKVHAAKRSGFSHVILPVENKDEVGGMDDGINIIAAGNIEEVIGFMFE